MADLSLIFDILARDRASSELNKVGDTAESTGKRVVGGLGVIAGGLAALGIGAFVAESIQSLQRIERINAQTESVIRSTGGAAGVTAQHIEDYAGALENATATEAESIQQGANLLATFTNIRNGVGQSNDIFDQTVSIATDMARAFDTTGGATIDLSGTSVQLGKALNDPIKGITALTRVGVSFTDQQKDQIRALVESGDVMGAQKVILAELNKEFGGAGEAFAASTAGKVELAKHALGTFGETILANTLPALADLASFAADGFNAAAEGFENGEVTAAGFDGAMQEVGATLADIYDVGSAVVGVVVDVGEFIGDLPGPVLGAATALGALVLLRGPITGAMGAISVGIGNAALVAASAAGQVGALGSAGAVARAGLGGVASFLGGPWGIAIGLGVTALGALAPALLSSSDETDELSAAQTDLAGAIRATSGAIDDSVKRAAAKALQDEDLIRSLGTYGIASQDLVGYVLNEEGAHQRVTAALDAQRDSYNENGLVSSGLRQGIEDQRAALDELAGTTSGTIADERELAEATGETADAQGGATIATQTMAAAQEQLAEDTSAAKQQVDAIRLALEQLGGATVDTTELESQFFAAIDAASGATKDLEGSLLNAAGGFNTQSEAGRAAAESLLNIRSTGLDLISNQAQLGETTDLLTGRAQALRDAFIATADEMGINRDEAAVLADQYGLIPGDVVTTVQANTGQASGALDGLFAQINQVAQNRVASIQFRASLSDVIGNLNPFGLADGGMVPGWSPHSRADNVPIAATAGEFMQPVRAVDHYGVEFMEQVRTRRFPLEAARGRYADGGLISLLGQADTAGASASIGKINAGFLDAANAAARTAVEPATDMARGLAYARSQVGKPYLWGSAGPAGFDCSGFMAAITNVIRGVSPGTRLGSTATFPWSGFASGGGMFTIGSTPNAGGGIGHMAGTLLGVNVESRGGQGVVVGPSARGASDSLFRERAHLATYDDGGLLQPGYTLAFNGTGKPESIRTAEQEAELGGRPIVINARVFVGDREITEIARVEVDQALGDLYDAALNAGAR